MPKKKSWRMPTWPVHPSNKITQPGTSKIIPLKENRISVSGCLKKRVRSWMGVRFGSGIMAEEGPTLTSHQSPAMTLQCQPSSLTNFFPNALPFFNWVLQKNIFRYKFP